MNPVQQFSRYFDISPANHKELMEQVFHIRYQVYCREFGYEKEQNYQGQQETDEYDSQSKHCLLTHTPSNKPIGCVRLIEADPQKSVLPLPFERFCSTSLDRRLFDPEKFLPGQIVEFSRLAVINQFRRRSMDGYYKINFPRVSPLRKIRRSDFPIIPVSLFLASLVMLLNSGADYGVAMMEPKLMRLMRMFGINFDLVGKPMEYHGLRAPYVIHRDNAIRYLKPDIAPLFFEIHQSLHKCDSNDRFNTVLPGTGTG